MCDQMTLRQYLDGKSIWAAINSAQSFPFTSQPGDIPTLDLMQVVNFGNRIMFNGLKVLEVDVVAGHIIQLYADKWNALAATAITAKNLGAKSSTSNTQTTTFDGDIKSTDNTVNQVSAFNSDDLINDTGNNTTGDKKTDNVTTVTGNGESFSLNDLFNNLPLADKTNIISIVLKDVSNYLTLSIY